MNALKTRVRNTKKAGIVRFLYMRNKYGFMGVCLDFSIIEEGPVYEEVRKHLETATQLHLETVRENKLSDELLNRLAPEEYWERYDTFHSKKGSIGIESRPYSNTQLAGVH